MLFVYIYYISKFYIDDFYDNKNIRQNFDI